jgi:D-alanyl-D-alanine carboxypeptidase/D-alanyl-D-alanine-endopeptidase (penicillin-binding protein 4)
MFMENKFRVSGFEFQVLCVYSEGYLKRVVSLSALAFSARVNRERVLAFKVLVLMLFYTFSFHAQTSKLKSEIENLKKDPALKHASWSVCVMNTKKDTAIAEYNSNISLVPASTLKIVTTGAALSILGNDFVFQTRLEYDGVFDTISGILKGNLYIRGGGDPSLESEYFRDKKDSLTVIEKWALIIKAKGLKKIEGAVIGDASIFEDNMTPSQWIWGDMGNYFGAGASGLSFRDNKYTVFFKSGAAGTKTSVLKTTPAIEGLQFVNNVTAGGSDDNAFIYGSQYSNLRVAQGTIPANKNNYEVDGSVPDPALSCAQALTIALQNIDVKIEKKAGTVRSMKDAGDTVKTNRKVIHTHHSPTLDKIIYYTNLKSNNLYAEHLLKYICYTKTGFGSGSKGTEIVTNFWKNKGVDVSGFFMNDGCGLARANVITTKTETQILRLMSKDKNFKAFYNSLPVAGRSGSLGGLCDGTFAENNLCAKSGYITRARGYAGYVKNKKGEMLCFSLLANNYDCSPTEMKKKLEKILVAIAEAE